MIELTVCHLLLLKPQVVTIGAQPLHTKLPQVRSMESNQRAALVFPVWEPAKPMGLEQCGTFSPCIEDNHTTAATMDSTEPWGSNYPSYDSRHSQLRDLLMYRWPSVEANRWELLWITVMSDPFGWWDNRLNKSKNDYYEESERSTTGHSLWPDGSRRACYRPGFNPGADHKEFKRGSGVVGIWTKSCYQGELVHAVECLDSLVQQGSYVDNSVFYDVIKRCIVERDLVLGCRVHALSVKSGLESNAFLASHIICMYASHGRLDEAKRVYRKVRSPSRYVWASIILGHARHGQPIQAIELYHQMRKSAATPDSHIFVAVLKACATAEDLCSGRGIHADILESAVLPNVFVGNCLLDMYSKCGSLEDARRVFDNMPDRDAVTWNSMIAGYARHGLHQEILTLYSSMQQEGIIAENRGTFFHLMTACASVQALQQGRQLHAQIQKKGLQADLAVGNCLVNMYAKCGAFKDARRVFDNLPMRDVITWTAMIVGHVEWGLGEEALALYASMQHECKIPANHVTLAYVLRACAQVGALNQGKQLHMEIQGRGLEAHVGVGTCVVDMYAKCGSLEDARRVFDKMPIRNVVTWTAMIAGYAEHKLGHEALALYKNMQQEGITSADVATFVCLLRACASVEALQQGKQLHAEIEKRGLGGHTAVGNCLIDMYVKCRSLEDARRVFDSMLTRDVVAWNVMIAGYAHSGFSEEALSLYGVLQQEGTTSADGVTFVCLLQACSRLVALETGKELHVELSKQGLDTTDLFVASALIDMYGKCGSMVDAHHVFSQLPRRDIVTWNVLMAGHSRQGASQPAFHLFERMRQEEGVQPNGITFLILLTVCSQVGLVEEGQDLFQDMSRDYGISPTMEHYNCMVDLLGRAGHLDKALQTVHTMPFHPDAVVWRIVLSACRKWNAVELGRHAFHSLVRLDNSDAAAYTLMSNIYSAAHMQEEMAKIQAMRVAARAWKEPGQSWWSGIDGVVHTFVVGDGACPQRQRIFAELGGLVSMMSEEGYVEPCVTCFTRWPYGKQQASA